MAEQRPDRPQRKGGRPGGPGNGGLKVGRGLFGWLLFIGLCVMLFMLLSKPGGSYKTIPFSEFMNVIEPGAGNNPAVAIASATSGNPAGAPGAPGASQSQGSAPARPSTGPSTPSMSAAP